MAAFRRLGQEPKLGVTALRFGDIQLASGRERG